MQSLHISADGVCLNITGAILTIEKNILLWYIVEFEFMMSDWNQCNIDHLGEQ